VKGKINKLDRTVLIFKTKQVLLRNPNNYQGMSLNLYLTPALVWSIFSANFGEQKSAVTYIAHPRGLLVRRLPQT
jgi:hypothetical protein